MYGIFLWLALGILLGIIAGLLPGIHTNTLLFLSLPFYFSLGVSILNFIAFIVGLSVTNTFIDFLPSIMIGVPESDTALSILPGHRYALQGRGLEAIKLTVFGGVSSSIFSLILLPFLFFLIPLIYPILEEGMHFILIGLLIFMLWRDSKKIFPLVIITLSSLLGILVLNSNLINSQYSLFPLFTGLFGVSTILISISQDVKLPEQNKGGELKRRDWSSGFKGFVAGSLAGFLPGLGSSQSILLLKEIFDMDLREFITSQGGVNTSAIFFSIISLYIIGKARSGSAIIIQRISETLDLSTVIFMIGLSMVTIAVASLLTLYLSEKFICLLSKMDYTKLLSVVLVFLFILVFFLTGVFGLLILLTSTSIGVTAILTSTRRSYCMSSLIVPTILYYAGFSSMISGLI